MLDLLVHFSVLICPIAGTAGLIAAAARHVGRNRVYRDRALACDAEQLLALLDVQEQHYAELAQRSDTIYARYVEPTWCDHSQKITDVYQQGTREAIAHICRGCGYYTRLEETVDHATEIARLKERLGIAQKEGAL